MKLVFYSLILNHHQACIADEFYKILGNDYAFVETAECHDSKGATDDYSQRPYLVKAWSSQAEYAKAMQMALEADVCVFGGYEALPFEKVRMQKGLLSFDMSERMLKRGLVNLASPRILKMVMAYHLGGWRNKPIYKLCCSAFTAVDSYKLLSYRGKCYKWGYFTHVDKNIDIEVSPEKSETGPTTFMWCSRLLVWKHPELPVQMAAKLKKKGYKFHIRMYGDEGNAAKHDTIYPRKDLQKLIEQLGVQDSVELMGSLPNNEVLDAMRESEIFLFTSDRMEGWGAVANESMANGCVLVASDAIGSSPYLIEDGVNGFMFHSQDVDSLTQKVEWSLKHPVERKKMRTAAYATMRDVWSPRKAAEALLKLIDDLKNGRETSILKGPCSKA